MDNTLILPSLTVKYSQKEEKIHSRLQILLKLHFVYFYHRLCEEHYFQLNVDEITECFAFISSCDPVGQLES